MTDTLFKQVNYTLGGLTQFIELGQIGLPDIQRPFVWPNPKVRDLLDSMYRGYPVGYLLFWQNAFSSSQTKVIGTDVKQKVPDLLIVDGQQRLTSLYAVMKGIPVIRENYDQELIEIAFNPLQGTFEVTDAAIRRDRSFIPNISVLWGSSGLFKIVANYLAELGTSREVSEDERRKVEQAFTKLHGLLQFPFTALELSKDIDEEQVSEVFVRINSAGKTLNQADFILTLMSVFWDSGRKNLESFCREARKPSAGGPSPFNHYIQPDPDQLLRVGVGIGFRRARLKHVYSILRGKDLETGDLSPERREKQFGVLQEAQAKALHIQYWHDYFKAIAAAGYLGKGMISSNNNLLYTYVLYLLGRLEYGVEEHRLRRTIARWFFMSAITGRYTDSPESRMEFDLARLREVKDKDAEGFVSVLDTVCDGTLTADFWSITLPDDLATSASKSPSMLAYHAALVLLDAKTLFSEQPVRAMLDPALQANRSAVERHHLFPKGYLKSLGVTETRDTNQIANFALVEWGDNGSISDQAPAKYLPVMLKRVAAKDVARMYYWHALPESWETMDYRQFLIDRRERIAKVIRDAYEKLRGHPVQAMGIGQAVGLPALVAGGETPTIEFKQSLRVAMHTGQQDPKIEHACLKTVAGFLNSPHGGRLVVGVADDGTPVGIEADGFASEDKMGIHLVNICKERLGAEFMMFVHPRFADYQGARVLEVECMPSLSPVWMKDGNAERFYVRAGASTAELLPSKAQDFIKMRFKK